MRPVAPGERKTAAPAFTKVASAPHQRPVDRPKPFSRNGKTLSDKLKKLHDIRDINNELIIN